MEIKPTSDVISVVDAGAALISTEQNEALIYKLFWAIWHREVGKLAMDVMGPEA